MVRVVLLCDVRKFLVNLEGDGYLDLFCFKVRGSGFCFFVLVSDWMWDVFKREYDFE